MEIVNSSRGGMHSEQRRAVRRDMNVGVRNRLSVLITVGVLLLLAFVLIVVMWMHMFGSTPESRISRIEVSVQQNEGVPRTNYQAVLADGVDWDKLSSSEQELTARQATMQAVNSAKDAEITSYTVLGITEQDRQPVFLYSGDETLIIYSEGMPRSVPLLDSE